MPLALFGFFLSLWQGCGQSFTTVGKIPSEPNPLPAADQVGGNIRVKERVALNWKDDGSFTALDKVAHIEGKTYYRLMAERKCLRADGSGVDTHMGRLSISAGAASELADVCAEQESSPSIDAFKVSALNPRLLTAPGRIYQERDSEPVLLAESDFPAVFCRSESADGLWDIYIRQSAENFLNAPAMTVEVSRGRFADPLIEGSENRRETIDAFPAEVAYAGGTAVFSSPDYKFDLSLQEGSADADWTALLRATVGTDALEKEFDCQVNDWNRILPLANKKPEVRLSSIPPRDSDSPIAVFSFDTINATAVECRVDGQAPLPCASPFDFTNLADGPHTVTITARSASGEMSAPAGFTWNIVAAPRPQVYFDDIYDQILEVSCDGCHIGFSRGGVSYRSYTSTLRTVVRGDAAASRLYDSVAKNRMPAGGRLSPQLKQMIADWINAGAPEDPPP